jgi:sorting nexin-25
MKSINKLKSLGEARRLRADVERELRNIGLVTVDPSNESEIRNKRKYEQRLERARSHIDERIAVLSGESRKVSQLGIPRLPPASEYQVA